MTTTSTDSSPPVPWFRKLAIQLLSGALVGFVASYGLLQLVDSPLIGGLGLSATIAALVGMLYFVIALSVLIGAFSPQLGARFLNVEDADELREQRRALILSGTAMGLWGAALVALAMAAPDGPVPQQAALVIAIGGLMLGALLSIPLHRTLDELMRAVNQETGALSYHLVLLIVGIWAILAHLGYVTAPQPLDLLASFYVLLLVATFTVIGRRGMLAVR